MIGLSVGLMPRYSQLFREIERPSAFTDISLFSPRTLWFLFLSVLFRNMPKWRYKDGENFSDIYARIQYSFRFIESLVEAHESVVIVSHSAYINLMVLYMCHGERLSLRELVATLMSINKLKNCEVVHVEYVGPTAKGTCPWMWHR
jgi:hypothetical protein